MDYTLHKDVLSEGGIIDDEVLGDCPPNNRIESNVELPLHEYPYRISTITAVGSLDGHININMLFDNIKLDSTHNIQSNSNIPCLVYLEFGKDKFDCQFKGDVSKRKIEKNNTNRKRRFDHQATLLFMFKGALINMKLFTNGNIQMTGVKSIEDGKVIIKNLITLIELYTKQIVQIVSYKICLINCDFKLPFEIRRDNLHDVFCKYYKTNCSYEPCIYPGVKLKYFSKPGNVNGVCTCKPHCSTKRNGNQLCCKISVSFFKSGCVIITGARNHTQIREVYDHIYDILTTHNEEVIMRNPLSELQSRVIYTGNIFKIKVHKEVMVC